MNPCPDAVLVSETYVEQNGGKLVVYMDLHAKVFGGKLVYDSGTQLSMPRKLSSLKYSSLRLMKLFTTVWKHSKKTADSA